MKKFRFYLPILIISLTINSCAIHTSDDIVFYPVKGIISVEAEHSDSLHLWKNKNYYTGIGIGPDFQDASMKNFADYRIRLDGKGSYYLHYLGNRSRNVDPGENIFSVRLIDEDHITVDSSLCIFPAINVPVWSSQSPESPEPGIKLDVSSKGNYTLRISGVKGSGYYIDKLLITTHHDYLPSGMGPVETTETQSDDIQRDRIILPPRWAFGVLYGGYTDHSQTLEVVDSLIQGDFPIDAYWIDSYFWDFNKGNGPKGYIDFTGDTAAFPNVSELWDQFEKRKIKAGIWIWNLIQKDGNETAYSEFLDRGYFSNTYLNTNGWHNETENTMTGSIDFENPEAAEYWKSMLKPFFDKGLDFLKLDNSSEIPFCKTAFEATQELGLETAGRGFILAHLHTTYDYRHKLYPTKWTGDAKITWSQPDYPNMWAYAMGGLKENIAMVADPDRSTYEVPFLSHDAGGYNYFGSTDQSEELYTRWIQFASMNSIMMFFSTAENPTRNHPYRYSKAVQDNFRKYTHLRMELFPYIYSYALSSHLTGNKMIQGMHGEGYQYLFGNEILIAPVFENGARSRKINLPGGNWIDPENGAAYEGNTTVTLDAPLDKLPMLIRSGAIIPKRNYARAIELGTNDTLVLDIYPSGKLSSFELLEDDGLSNEYLEGIYASTKYTVQSRENETFFVIEPIVGSYKEMKQDRVYHLQFKDSDSPGKVIRNGKEVSDWNYDENTRQLSLRFKANKSQAERIHISY